MKFVLAGYGTRGDVEPCAAVGRELLRRGHEVHLAVAPDLVGFVESVGLAPVAYGPDARVWQDLHRELLTHMFGKFWRIRELQRLRREDWQLFVQCWDEARATLMSLADGADLLLTVVIAEQVASNVAEYYDVPLATLHTFPMRPNGQLVPMLPASWGRSAMAASEWLGWPMTKKLEDAQRRELHLSKATGPSSRRIAERGSLEIQAYDQVCFPGLAAEWAKWTGPVGSLRPFTGPLTLELPTDVDDEVASWIAAGTPPIFFGFGSTVVLSPANTVAMISGACAQLGVRALVCSAETDFSQVADSQHVKVVGAMNYGAVFPACRAVVHHGGGGTTAAGLRAGVPQLILSTLGDQTLWGARVKRLKVGSTRRLSGTTQKTLIADLTAILDPRYVARAREIATQMTAPDKSVAVAADFLESCARLRRVG